MPGVVVATEETPAPTLGAAVRPDQFFVVGQAERGSVTEPIAVRGMADVESRLGSRVTYGALYDTLRLFFEEGGKYAVVARVVGTTPTVGTLTIQDRAGVPVNTIRVDAANPGAWSTRLTVEVLDGSVADTFRLVVRLDGEIVEDRTNLASPAAAATAFASSNWIRVTNLGSATAAPDNNPDVQAATALSAGDDDRGTIAASDYTDALDQFEQGLGDGCVAIPGQGSAVHAALVAHCEANRRIALLADAVDASVDTMIATAAANRSSHAGLFGPWVRVTDDAGGYREISPEGFVAAARAKAHLRDRRTFRTWSPWRAAAGAGSVARSILGLAQSINREDGERADAGRVSVIRLVAGRVRLYGWRSTSDDETNYGMLTAQDTINRLIVECERVLEQYVFQPIDGKGQMQARMQATLTGVVEPMSDAGGLFSRYDADGDLIDPGYLVETGSSVNTLETLANNEVRARLAVRVSPVGALVSLTIVKVGILSGL